METQKKDEAWESVGPGMTWVWKISDREVLICRRCRQSHLKASDNCCLSHIPPSALVWTNSKDCHRRLKKSFEALAKRIEEENSASEPESFVVSFLFLVVHKELPFARGHTARPSCFLNSLISVKPLKD